MVIGRPHHAAAFGVDVSFVVGDVFAHQPLHRAELVERHHPRDEAAVFGDPDVGAHAVDPFDIGIGAGAERGERHFLILRQRVEVHLGQNLP